MFGKPRQEYIPAGGQPSQSLDISFTARDAFAYITALPLTALAAMFFYTFTLDLAHSIFSVFLPYSIALICAYGWLFFASFAFLFAAKSVLANICQALAVRLKLGILNMGRR